MALSEEQKKKLGLDTPEKAAAFEAKYGIPVGPAPGSKYEAGMSKPSLDMSEGAAVSSGAPPSPPPTGMGMSATPTPAVGYAMTTAFEPKPLVPNSAGVPTPQPVQNTNTEDTPATPEELEKRKAALKQAKIDGAKADVGPITFHAPAPPPPAAPKPAIGGGPAPAIPENAPPWWKEYLEKTYPELIQKHIGEQGGFAANEAGIHAAGLANQADYMSRAVDNARKSYEDELKKRKFENDYLKAGEDMLQKKSDEVFSKGISEDRFWARDGGARGAMSFIGVLLGAFATPYTGGRNLAVEQVEKMIDRDLAVQKYNLDHEKEGLKNQRGLLQDYYNIYKDRQLAYDAAQATYWGLVGKEIEAMSAKTKSEIAKAQIPALLEQTEFRQATAKANFAKNLAMKAAQEAAARLALQQKARMGAAAGGPDDKIREMYAKADLDALSKLKAKLGPNFVIQPYKLPNGATVPALIDIRTGKPYATGSASMAGDNAVKTIEVDAAGKPIKKKDGTYQYKPGTAVNKPAIKDINEANNSMGTANTLIEEIKKLREEVGVTGSWTGAKKTALLQKMGLLRGEIGRLGNLGVLSKEERADIESRIGDPTAVDFDIFHKGDQILKGFGYLQDTLWGIYKTKIASSTAEGDAYTGDFEDNAAATDITNTDEE